MKKIFYLILLSPSFLFSQTLLWPSGPEEINTGANSTYIVQSVVLDNTEIVFGYNIGAFYLNDEGEFTCGGISAWTGLTTQIAVYGDDTTTPEKDGFTDGEQITFFALNTYNNLTYDASAQFLNGSLSFSANGINIISEFTLTPRSLCPPLDFNALVTSSNMTFFITSDGADDLSSLGNGNIGVFFTDDNGLEVCGGYVEFTGSQIQVPAYSDDSTTSEKDGFADGEIIVWKFQDSDGNQFILSPTPNDLFSSNGLSFVSSISYEPITCDGVAVLGCTDITYIEFNSEANTDDGSCLTQIIQGCTDSNYIEFNSEANFDLDPSLCLTEIVLGCINSNYAEYWNYETVLFNNQNYYYLLNPIYSYVTNDDGSCENLIIEGCVDDSFLEYSIEANIFDMDQCQTIIVYGCTDNVAFNYNFIANVNDGSCIAVIEGCTDATAFNYDEIANTDNGSCIAIILGCTDETAFNYDENANTDNGSCVEKVYGCIDNDFLEFNELANTDNGDCSQLLVDAYQNLNQVYSNLTESHNELISSTTTSLSSLQQALDNWNTTADLISGWNIIGYGCPIPKNVEEVLSNHIDKIIITKDNNGSIHMPEYNFNGIGDFTPGFGYQIKITEAIEGFSLCDWYVNDIPEDNIVSLQDSLELINSQIGCTDILACNHDINKLYDDGSCEYPAQGYDCDGNITEYEVGMEAEGGIVFYVDETGQHGLVAAMEDLTDGASDPNGWGVGYEWGCYQNNITGAEERNIGFGYQNTLDVVNQNCSTVFGGITAAEASLEFEANGYSDWYLPSIDELFTLYINLEALDISQDNIFGFENAWYWSSTQNNHWSAECVNFNTGSLVVVPGSTYSDYDGNTPLNYSGGHVHHNGKDTSRKVRPIRSF